MNDDTIRLPGAFTTLRESQANTTALTTLARQLLAIVKGIVLLLVHALAFGPELLLHAKFGERYLSPWMLLLTLALPFLWFQDSPILVIIWTALLFVAFIIHFIHRQLLRRKGELWHSRSSGVPHKWLQQFKHEWITRALWVPFHVITIGIALSLMHVSIGSYLVLCAIAVTLKCYAEHLAFRERVMDTIDAQIESQYLADALRGEAAPSESCGLIVAGSGRLTAAELEALGLTVEFDVESPPVTMASSAG